MQATLKALLERLEVLAASDSGVIHWAAPVPSFGDLSKVQVATVGINPSNREFVDEKGHTLYGTQRRFHTLDSLGITSWSQIQSSHLQLVQNTCNSYFFTNPFNRWFKRLNQVVSGTNRSYYDALFGACHIDIIPYATTLKWSDLTTRQRLILLGTAGDTLGLLLRKSAVRLLILNGRAVVDHFERINKTRLDCWEMPSWSLLRQSTPDVKGIAYRGTMDEISGVPMGNEILVLGFNHNLQSSFGVTAEVIHAIRTWVADNTKNVLP